MSESYENLGISELKREAMGRRVYAIVGGQVEGLVKKETKDGKPFWELGLSDGQGKMTLRAWSDAPAYGNCENLAVGEFILERKMGALFQRLCARRLMGGLWSG